MMGIQMRVISGFKPHQVASFESLVSSIPEAETDRQNGAIGLINTEPSISFSEITKKSSTTTFPEHILILNNSYYIV